MIRRFAALLPLIFLAGCAGVTLERPLQIHLVDVVPQDMTLLEQRMRILVRIRNPNNQPVAIGGLRFSLSLNKVRLLEALSNKKVEIPRLGEAVTSVSATTTTLTLIRQVLEIDPDKPINYRIEGTVFLEGVFGSQIPFKNEGRINLPKLLNTGGESLRPILK